MAKHNTKIGHDYYGDGIFKNFFPIDTVRNMGAERIIIPTIRNYKQERMEPYNAFTALMRGLYIRDYNTKKERELKIESRSSDVVMVIDAHDLALTSIKNLELAIEKGYRKAREVLHEVWEI